MTMADTVAVMNKGRIEQLGSPAMLYELPRTAFVANFLGQSNLFTGPVVGTTADSISVDIEGCKIVVPKSRAQRQSGNVTVGVRPEKLTLHLSEPRSAAGTNSLGPGRVIDVSFSGVSTQYIIAIPGLGSVVLFMQNTGAGPLVADGAEAWVSWSVEHGFGLEDEAYSTPRFDADADTDTASIAVQKKRALLSELEEA